MKNSSLGCSIVGTFLGGASMKVRMKKNPMSKPIFGRRAKKMRWSCGLCHEINYLTRDLDIVTVIICQGFKGIT